MSTIPLPVSGGKNRIVCDGLTFWVYYDKDLNMATATKTKTDTKVES